MPTQILMPALSPTMTEGNLAKWLKSEGDSVEAGDVIAEIETDKATMEVEAVDEGVLGKILIAEGTEGVAVNTPIAVLLEDGVAGGGLLELQQLRTLIRLEGEQAVEVVALIHAAGVWVSGVWLGPRQQTLEEREATEHATGFRIGRDDGVVDAEA